MRAPLIAYRAVVCLVACAAATWPVLAASGADPAAFDRRCIPADCVAPPSHIPDILSRRALSAGRLAGLGATLDLHHGLLAQQKPAAGSGPLPEDMSTYQCAHWDGDRCDDALSPPFNNPLVGTWVRISLLRNSFSVQPPDAPLYVFFGADGYYSMMEFPAGRPKVGKPLEQQTPQELLSRFDKLEGAYGTYTINGQLVNRHSLGGMSPGADGEGDQLRGWHFEGNIMPLTGTGPTRSPQARMRRLPIQPLSSRALVGTWERTALNADGQAVTGPAVKQWLMLGEDGWFHQTVVPKGRINPKKPIEQYTTQDFVAAYSGLSASRGTYSISGSTLTRHYVANLDPNLTGRDEGAQFTVTGETMTVQGTNEAGAKVQATYTRLKPLDPFAPPAKKGGS